MEKNDIYEVQKKYNGFLENKQSLILSTFDKDQPHASYAPFVKDREGNIFIYISKISKHTQNLFNNSKASIMFIQDEQDAKNPFMRERLTFDALTYPISRKSEIFDRAMLLFKEKFDSDFDLFEELPDFMLFKLVVENGRFIIGFGRAYEVSWNDMDKLVHIKIGHKSS